MQGGTESAHFFAASAWPLPLVAASSEEYCRGPLLPPLPAALAVPLRPGAAGGPGGVLPLTADLPPPLGTCPDTGRLPAEPKADCSSDCRKSRSLSAYLPKYPLRRKKCVAPFSQIMEHDQPHCLLRRQQYSLRRSQCTTPYQLTGAEWLAAAGVVTDRPFYQVAFNRPGVSYAQQNSVLPAHPSSSIRAETHRVCLRRHQSDQFDQVDPLGQRRLVY